MELIVLGVSGAFGAPSTGCACSGYLVRAGSTAVWVDCGNGTFPNLQEHIPVEDLSAVVISHEHPDHCVDIYGLNVLCQFALERGELPVFAPGGVEEKLGALVDEWAPVLVWNVVADGDKVEIGDLELRFSRTQHPPPTLAIELRGDGKRLVYTSDTGPDWSVGAFEPRADLVLSEASFQHDSCPAPIHLSARQAGEAARAAKARRLMLTHLWPTIDPVASVEEGSEAFGEAVTLAAPHMVTRI